MEIGALTCWIRWPSPYHRDYLHRVEVQNGGDWRAECWSRQHYVVTGGPLVRWFEAGKPVYGFKTADQAAAFLRWLDSCGIDWSTRTSMSPL